MSYQPPIEPLKPMPRPDMTADEYQYATRRANGLAVFFAVLGPVLVLYGLVDLADVMARVWGPAAHFDIMLPIFILAIPGSLVGGPMCLAAAYALMRRRNYYIVVWAARLLHLIFPVGTMLGIWVINILNGRALWMLLQPHSDAPD